MEVDKQLKFKSHERMQAEFVPNKEDVMTPDCLSSVALAIGMSITGISRVLTNLKKWFSYED